MKENNFNPDRPSGKLENKESGLKDENSAQPGVSTISSKETDEKNQDISRTASDNFRETPDDPNADAEFDDIEEYETGGGD